MLASLKWLTELCRVDDDPDHVANALTDRGLTVDAVEAQSADTVFEIDVPANRPDCLGHLGLARELSAAFGVPLRDRGLAGFPQSAGEAGEILTVQIEAPELCSRYTARIVRGVRVGASPDWVVRRLESCGLRSVNNVVDISNLVLLETGNPIHFFDLSRLEGPAIVVRTAASGETLTSLDGIERELTPEMLVIADAARPVALAGVMGGADSEIGEASRDVLIEAAAFDPLSIRRTARKLGMQTDASHRFERGADPLGVEPAQRLAVALLEELAGGTAIDGCVDCNPRPHRSASLELRSAQLSRLLGYQPEETRVRESLTALGLDPQGPDEGRWTVQVPSWRVDLGAEADLVEEVARHLGYDRIPTTVPAATPSAAGMALEERGRDLLARLGFNEAFGYSMIGMGEDEPFVTEGAPPAMKLENPIADWLACLRRSLLPGLLRAVELNHRRGNADVRLFEVGHVFLARPGDFPSEPLHLGLAWSGAAAAEHWSGTAREVDFFDLLGLVDRVLHSVAAGRTLRREALARPGFHPGRSAVWKTTDGGWVALAAQVHPEHQGETQGAVFVAEIDLTRAAPTVVPTPTFSALPRLTPVSRDLALVLTDRVSYRQVEETLAEVDPPARVRFLPVDRYTGPPLATGESSLTVRLTLLPSERTLTEEEIEEYRSRLVEALDRRLGVKIRS